MRHKSWVLIMTMVLAVVVIAAPASAKEPLRGDQVMVLNQNLDGSFGAFGCPDLSWFGEITIGGTSYGMALYPLPGKGFTGQDRVLHYTEGWRIFDGHFALDEGMQIEDCVPGPVLLAGTDGGVGQMATQKFHSTGVVQEAYPPFEEWLDRHVYQYGIMAFVEFDGVPDLFGFYGGLRLN